VLVDALTHFGLPGVVMAIMVTLYVAKDRELTRERTARIDDAKAFHQVVLGVQEKAIQTANRLTDVFEEMKEEMRRR